MPSLFEATAHAELLWWFVALSVLMFVGTLVLLPLLLIRIPADYFCRPRGSKASGVGTLKFWLYWINRVVRTVIGLVFVGVGVLLLVLPGQGMLTIVAGLMMMDFPGKRRLELWLLRRPRVLHGVNWLRMRYGRPNLQLPKE